MSSASDRPLRLGYVSEIPTPYRRPFLLQLAGDARLELTVLYLASTQGDRDWGALPQAPEVEHVVPGFHWCANRSAGYYNRFNPRLFGWLSPARFDAVVFGAYYVASMWLGMYWCLLRGLPYVMLCESHGRRPRSRWRVWCKDRLIGTVMRRAGAWLPLGTLARDYLVSYGADPERCFFCPNTPDVDALGEAVSGLPPQGELRTRWGVPPDSVVVLYVGRFIAIKRLDMVLEAVSRLQGAGRDVALLFAGGGPLAEPLRARAESLGVRNVHWAGFVQPEDLPAVYGAADVLVLASDDEPWGVVVNEAMACGLPVVASDRVGAAADLVVEGRTGFRFPGGDGTALCQCLERFCENATLAASMGAACRAQARDWGYALCHESVVAAARCAAGRGGR